MTKHSFFCSSIKSFLHLQKHYSSNRNTKENKCGTASKIAYTTRNGSFTLRHQSLAMFKLVIIFTINALFGSLPLCIYLTPSIFL